MEKKGIIRNMKVFGLATTIALSGVLVGCQSNPKEEDEVATVEEPTEKVETSEVPEIPTQEVTPSEEENEAVIEEGTVLDKYLNLPIYTDKDRAVAEDLYDCFSDVVNTEGITEMKEEWAAKIEYFKRFIQNDPNATYGGYTIGELSTKTQESIKNLYHNIDNYLSMHIDSYDHVKETVKDTVSEVLHRGKNGWNYFKDHEWQTIKEKTKSFFDKHFPKEYE